MLVSGTASYVCLLFLSEDIFKSPLDFYNIYFSRLIRPVNLDRQAQDSESLFCFICTLNTAHLADLL